MNRTRRKKKMKIKLGQTRFASSGEQTVADVITITRAPPKNRIPLDTINILQ